MFALITFFLGCLCEDQTFAQQASLLVPYVDNGGNSVNWSIFDECLIKAHGSHPFLQLGYSTIGSSGAIMTNHQIGSDRFSIDLNIEIDEGDVKKEGDDGMAIWMSNETVFSKGSCLGRSCSFKGLLVVIKILGDPYIGVKTGDISIDPRNMSSSLDRVFYGDISYNNPFLVRIVQNNYELSVYIGKTHDSLHLVHSCKSKVVEKDFHLGVSTSTGQASNSFRLLGVESYHLKSAKGGYMKEEVHHGGRLIWILFFAVVGITGYYLYSIQIKKKS